MQWLRELPLGTQSDDSILQLVHKQSGHGPYLWAVVWIDARTCEQNVSVYSFWEDARERCDAFQANGHVAQIDLAVDNTRKVSIEVQS